MRIALYLLLVPACVAQVRMNDIQVIGTHNSYHAGLPANGGALLAKTNPKLYAALNYKHVPLEQQLASGIRQFEIDIFADPQGGRFADPAGPHRVQSAGLPADPPFDPQGLMKKPGFKVLHVQDVDYRSTCQPFTACLTILRTWSKANPGHIPLFVLIENKDNTTQGTPTQALKMTSELFDQMDAEIRSVFGPEDMITPDDVRGSRTSLEEAVLKNGWPTLEKARGKVVFVMDQARFTQVYAAGHPALRGRVLFTNSRPGTPETAFIQANEPDVPYIQGLIRKGYIVRTRADADLTTPADRRAAALASGAQMISTDFPFRFEGNAIARCNPVRNNPSCRNETLR